MTYFDSPKYIKDCRMHQLSEDAETTVVRIGDRTEVLLTYKGHTVIGSTKRSAVKLRFRLMFQLYEKVYGLETNSNKKL